MPMLIICDSYVIDGEKRTDATKHTVRDFEDATYVVMRDMVETMNVGHAVSVMREWLQHDGSESFTIARENGVDMEFSYAYML